MSGRGNGCGLRAFGSLAWTAGSNAWADLADLSPKLTAWWPAAGAWWFRSGGRAERLGGGPDAFGDAGPPFCWTGPLLPVFGAAAAIDVAKVRAAQAISVRCRRRRMAALHQWSRPNG